MRYLLCCCGQHYNTVVRRHACIVNAANGLIYWRQTDDGRTLQEDRASGHLCI